MNIYKYRTNGKTRWRFDKRVAGQRLQAKGFKTRKDVQKALHEAIEKAEMIIKVHRSRLTEDLTKFREKYRNLYENPQNTIADLFDMIMAEMDIPCTFKDVRQWVENCKTNKKKMPARLRYKILERDNYTCQRCGDRAPNVKLHVDHLIALSRGGMTEERNLMTLCQKCNMGKGDKPFIITED